MVPGGKTGTPFPMALTGPDVPTPCWAPFLRQKVSVVRTPACGALPAAQGSPHGLLERQASVCTSQSRRCTRRFRVVQDENLHDHVFIFLCQCFSVVHFQVQMLLNL